MLQKWTISTHDDEEVNGVDNCAKAKEESCNGEGLCGDGGGGCGSSSNGPTPPSLEEILLLVYYACRIVVKGLGRERVPVFLEKEAARVKRRERVKESIQDFLL